jgi:DNA-binding HxlR family transcriptional regulator
VVDVLSGGEKGPSEIAREIGDVNPTQISGLLRQLASEGVVSRNASGKWHLTAATQHQEAQAAEPAAPEAEAAADPETVSETVTY